MKKYLNKFRKKIADASHCHKINIDPNTKYISFTFDDVPGSAFLNAQKILDKYDKKGTYYIALSFLEGQPENQNYYSLKDLTSCVSNGHELACHTYRHVRFYNMWNRNSIKTEIFRNQQVLDEIGIACSFENFSYPFGQQTKKAKRVVSDQFLTCRGIEHGINKNKVDTNNLKAVRLYEKTNSLQKIFSILEDFSDSGGWLIFYTHDVETNYSKYGCSTEYFEAVLKKCVELGIEIKPVKEIAQKLEITIKL